MPTLFGVCVWTMPFPPEGVGVSTGGSPNVYFTTECEAIFVNIPDTAFLDALIEEGVDTNGDSLISYGETAPVTKLDVSLRSISDLTGIEAFINLDTLDAQCNPISIFDVSNNTKLKYINVSSYGPMGCGSCMLDSLDLSDNPALEYLGWGNNELVSLDISNNLALKYLECSRNNLVSLDVSNNNELAVLRCSGNQLTDLDISNNTSLVELKCGSNQITDLDVANNPELQDLWCSSAQLSGLDISQNTDLSNLQLKDMPTLHEVCVWTMPFPPEGVLADTTGSPNVYFTTECGANFVNIPDTAFLYALIDEGVDTNGDRLISYPEAEATIYLHVNEKSISSLTGIEAFINLKTLECTDNQLTSLDVSNNTALVLFACMRNQLTSLDVSTCSALFHLHCDFNQLTSLDISGCTALKALECDFNQLASLDVSGCTALEHLSCQGNLLTSLDISNNTALTYIELSDIPTLNEVCVWTLPFPPDKVVVSKHYSPNVCFETDCSGECGDEATGIIECSQTGWFIYPNPTYELVTIKSIQQGHKSIEITSLNGQLIFNEEIEGMSHQIDLSAFYKGVYFITIRSEYFVKTQKIIKL